MDYHLSTGFSQGAGRLQTDASASCCAEIDVQFFRVQPSAGSDESVVLLHRNGMKVAYLRHKIMIIMQLFGNRRLMFYKSTTK